MNNFIINPLWIYFIDLFSGLDIFMCILASILGCALGVGGIGYTIWRTDSYSSNCEEDVKFSNYAIKVFKKCTVALIISLIFSFLIPGEKTLYTMLVASYATTENIEMAGNTIISFVDYVAEKVDEMNDDD